MVHLGVGEDGGNLQRRAKIRLRRLVAAQAALAMLPAAARLLPMGTRYFGESGHLFDLALKGALLAQLTLLAFWAGLSTSRIVWRISAAALGCVYLAFWQTIGGCAPRLTQFGLAPGQSPEDVGHLSWDAVPQNVMHSAGAIGLFCAIFAAAFFVVRRWFNKLEWMPAAMGAARDRAIKYAGFAALAATADVALLFIAGREMNLAHPLGWDADASTACVALPVNTMCAVWATLGAGRVRRRVLTALLLAASMAVCTFIGGYSVWFGVGFPYGATLNWWKVVRWVMVSLLPLAVLIGSLLAVRSCGYRLAPRSAENKQFTLCELLTVFSLACAALAFVVVPPVRQRRAVTALEAAGGSVHYRQTFWEPDETLWRMFPANGLQRLLPRDCFDEVESVSLDYAEIIDASLVHLRALGDLQSLSLTGNPISDDALSHLRGLKRLRELDLGECPITDAGLANLSELTQLEHLELGNTGITDEGMIHLREFARLESLWLTNTQITDAGLGHLEGLTQLQHLGLRDTAASEASMSRLRQALPNVRIYGP